MENDDDQAANHLGFIKELLNIISDWSPVEVSYLDNLEYIALSVCLFYLSSSYLHPAHQHYTDEAHMADKSNKHFQKTPKKHLLALEYYFFQVKTILISQSTWRRNEESVAAIALRLKECLSLLDEHQVLHSSEIAIRKAIRENDLGATSNTSQWFNKTGLLIDDKKTTRKDKEQKVCIYIKRSVLKEDVLQQLDRG